MSEEMVTQVDLEDTEFNNALRASEKDRKESERMQKLYTGYGKGQWSVDTKNKLELRGSLVPQINLLKGKIKRLAGTVVKNFFDVSFVPVSTAEIPLTRKLNGIFTSDSNTFDYDTSYLKCVLNGLIHQGIEQMKLSTRYSPMGNITFENILPGNILIDPFWKSEDTWDINSVWKVAYLTPKQIVDTYGHKNDRIKSLIGDMNKNGTQYDPDDESEAGPYWNMNYNYGHKYRVIEHHYLETEVQTVKLARVKETNEEIELPDAMPDAMDQLDAMGIANSEIDDFIERRITKKIYKVKASCMELDGLQLLEDGKSDIQIGRLPFFPFSADRHGGQNCGIAVLLEDAQKLINGREAQSDEMIASSIKGAHLVDPMLFGGNDALTERAMQDMTRADAKIKTAAGMLASGRQLIQPIQKAPYAGEIQNEIVRIAGYLDSLSGQTATLDGGKESSHDTGTLFVNRTIQAEIALTVLTKNLEAHQRDKFEAWMLYAPKVYGGAYREITHTDKNGKTETITVNKRVYTEDGASGETQDDIAKMRRHKVIITPSKDGLTVRETDRARNVELLNVVTNPIARAILERNAMETVDNSLKEKAEMNQVYDLFFTQEVTKVELEIAMMQAQLASMKMQNIGSAQELAAGGQPQAPGAEQGQLPQEAAPTPQGMNNAIK